MFSACFCCLLLASSDSAHMVCLMWWYHTVVLSDQIAREAALIRELGLDLWIIKLVKTYNGSSEMENKREHTSGQVVSAYRFLFIVFQDRKLNIVQILNRQNWYRTQEQLMQIHCLLNQHYFFSLLLSTSDRNLLPLAPKQCGLLLWTWLCRSTREKELSLKRPCNLVGVKDGKNGTTYRRDWKRCTFSSQVNFFFF